MPKSNVDVQAIEDRRVSARGLFKTAHIYFKRGIETISPDGLPQDMLDALRDIELAIEATLEAVENA